MESYRSLYPDKSRDLILTHLFKQKFTSEAYNNISASTLRRRIKKYRKPINHQNVQKEMTNTEPEIDTDPPMSSESDVDFNMKLESDQKIAKKLSAKLIKVLSINETNSNGQSEANPDKSKSKCNIYKHQKKNKV